MPFVLGCLWLLANFLVTFFIKSFHCTCHHLSFKDCWWTSHSTSDSLNISDKRWQLSKFELERAFCLQFPISKLNTSTCTEQTMTLCLDYSNTQRSGWDCDLSFPPYFLIKWNKLMEKTAMLCEMFCWHCMGPVKGKHHSKSEQSPSGRVPS